MPDAICTPSYVRASHSSFSTIEINDCLRCIISAAQRVQTLIFADADCRFDTVVPFWLDTLHIKYTIWHNHPISPTEAHAQQ